MRCDCGLGITCAACGGERDRNGDLISYEPLVWVVLDPRGRRVGGTYETSAEAFAAAARCNGELGLGADDTWCAVTTTLEEAEVRASCEAEDAEETTATIPAETMAEIVGIERAARPGVEARRAHALMCLGLAERALRGETLTSVDQAVRLAIVADWTRQAREALS